MSCISFIFCVLTDQMHNFRKQVTNNLNSPYDYGSVMHYGRWAALWGNMIIVFVWVAGVTLWFTLSPSSRYAFSEDGGPTIIPKPDPYIPIGQRDGPSLLDLHKINVLYNCGRWTYRYTDWKTKLDLTFKMIDDLFSLLPTIGATD